MVAAAMLEGLPPNRAAHVMRLACEEGTARRIAAIIVETFDPATTAAAAFEEAPDTSGSNNGPWIVEAYFGDPPDEANVRALVGIVAGAAAARAASFDRVDERDWVGASLEGLTPVRAGRFLIHGAHGRDAVKANDIAIEIEAALAFGTGHHGSTRGCLHMLDSSPASGVRAPASISAPAPASLPSRRPNCSSAKFTPGISTVFA